MVEPAKEKEFLRKKFRVEEVLKKKFKLCDASLFEVQENNKFSLFDPVFKTQPSNSHSSSVANFSHTRTSTTIRACTAAEAANPYPPKPGYPWASNFYSIPAILKSSATPIIVNNSTAGSNDFSASSNNSPTGSNNFPTLNSIFLSKFNSHSSSAHSNIFPTGSNIIPTPSHYPTTFSNNF
ncbi:unnamed protein product [Acanthosepion pharaonis]|uniref:Uncharacterized protein n=1 Tax=Acanthosepion pharaonis TaxID=158019 RepID=A0A812CG67_ACAPH|nr:unnamed protein product [Sepia pharaonis]